MQVTALDGSVHNFDENMVTFVSGPKPTDTDARFYIHGLITGSLVMAGDPLPFMMTMANVSDFAELTFGNGHKFWVNALRVTTVSTLTAAQQALHPHASALLAFGALPHFISEAPNTAIAAINAAGGSL